MLPSLLTRLFKPEAPAAPDPADAPESTDRPSDPSVDKEAATKWIADNYQKVKTSYITFHQSVWQAILFYVGQTWLQLDQARRWWIPAVAEDDFTPQPKINYFAPTIDAIASNFNHIPPVECVAQDAMGDEQYRRDGVARVCRKLADNFIIRTGLKSDFKSRGDRPSEAAMMFILGASCFTNVYSRDGDTVASPTLGDLTEQVIEVDLLSSLEIMPRPGSFNIGGMDGTPYLYAIRRMTLEQITARFGVTATPDNESIAGTNNIYQAALNYFYTGANAVELQSEDSALVLEVFIPPQGPDSGGVKEFAQTGLYAVFINNEAKYCSPWDFPDHPITKFDYIRVPRLFFGRTPAFDLCGIQEELQSYESIIKLHGMTNAVSPWVVDQNTLVGEITGRADKVIRYRSIGPNSPAPKREQPGHLDNGIYEQIQKLRSMLDSISGAASVFRGRQEGSVVAASAIAQLRGQAELLFSKPVQNWNNGWKETIRKAVLLMQKRYTLPQILRIVGEGLENEVQDFLDADLDNDVEWLAADHGLPRTQDEMRQEMLLLFDKKALDPNDPNVKEKLYRLFGETGMMTMFNLDATRARFENKGMKSGKPPVFRPAFEDLPVHYALHTEFIKSLEFDRLPPQIQEIFLAHAMETKTAMAPPPPPPPPETPLALGISGKLEDMPPALVDAILEKKGVSPAPDVAPPPHHTVGKPPAPGELPPATGHHPGTSVTQPKSDMASHGQPTGSPLHPTGQGIHPIGTSKGAPPAPNTP